MKKIMLLAGLLFLSGCGYRVVHKQTLSLYKHEGAMEAYTYCLDVMEKYRTRYRAEAIEAANNAGKRLDRKGSFSNDILSMSEDGTNRDLLMEQIKLLREQLNVFMEIK